ncbi:MAG: AmmeMemoRadiSam system protein B, partial [Patescibacteria group bacterium]|nr:AmmeMemoRadiSam system protein B [Patescibacteria group bacterium]
FAKQSQEKSGKHIFGAIVPHHLFASFIIADIFAKIAQQDTQTLILLAPNHQNIGNTPVLTSELAWETPHGKILPDAAMIGSLIQKDYISVDENILDNEHALGSLLPFIAYNNDAIRIVPLILRQNITKEQLQDLSKSIANIIDDKTIVVASVDFSHYLNSDEAEKNDEKTLQVMERRDYSTLLQMNSDYLDSPEAITVLLQVMEQLGAKSFEVLHHTNSGKLMDDLQSQATSYFGAIFTK